MSSLAGALLIQVSVLAAPQPPSLATAAELLAERGLTKACATVTKLGLAAPDTSPQERVRLYLVAATQSARDGDAPAALKAMEDALKLDRRAQLPPFATEDARSMLEDVRARLPVKPKPPNEPAPAHPREAPAHALARAFDALYLETQLDGAGLVLDLAERAQPLSKEDQAQLAIRRGILRMDLGEETQARNSFAQAQDLDPAAKPPDYIPPRTLGVFDELRRKNASLQEGGSQASRKRGARPIAGPDGPRLEPVSTTLMISGGVVAVTGLIVFIANSQSTSTAPPSGIGPLNTGQAAGGIIGVVGIAAVAGGYFLSQQPELLSVRLGVSPVDRGGILVAAGHF